MDGRWLKKPISNIKHTVQCSIKLPVSKNKIIDIVQNKSIFYIGIEVEDNVNKSIHANSRLFDATTLSAVAPDSPCSSSNRHSSGDDAPPRDGGADGGDAVGDGDDATNNNFHQYCRWSSTHRWNLLEMIWCCDGANPPVPVVVP